MENVVSNAERRALIANEKDVTARIGDIYAALPAITGKLELEYEGEQRGAVNVARDLISAAAGKTFEFYFDNIDCSEIIAWFDDGGTIRVSDTDSAETCLKNFRRVAGLINAASESGLADMSKPALTSAVCELLLEGLHAQKKISRSDERGYAAAKPNAKGKQYESFSRSRRIN
jgi:magnesium chelatase subunit I